MLANLLRNLAGMAYRCRIDEYWTMEFVSEGCLGLTGYPAEALVGNRQICFEEIMHAADRTGVRDAVARAVVSGERFSLTYRIVTAGGEERWVMDQGFAVTCPDDPTPYLEGIVTDVTAQKCAEEALATSERTLSAIFEHTFEFIGLLDPAGNLLRANETAMRLVGLPLADVQGKPFWELPWWRHSGDEQIRLKDAVSRAADGYFVRYETTHVAADGRTITVDFSLKPVWDEQGNVVAIIPEGRDISERKRAEQALGESEERFSKAFRASPYSMTISELATGRLLEVNAGFEKVSGFLRDEVVGKTSVEIGVWDVAEDRQRLVCKLQEEGSVRGLEMRFRHRNGELVITHCSAELVEIGGVACLLNVIEDITARRAAEARRDELEARLRQAQKMEELGQLAGGIAHDFNNILTGVIAYTELATLDAADPVAVRRHLGEVRKAGDRARDLVRQIMTFSRQQPHERRPIRLHTVIEEAVKLLRSTLPSTVEIVVDLDRQAPVVLADPSQVHQLVMNLCINASHAIGAQPGRLTITLDEVTRDAASLGVRPVEVPGKDIPCARLRVADTGSGMTPETLKRIFEPFFTTKSAGEGTGLGLAVVHGIVEEHDGVVCASSTPGAGSVFEVILPRFVAVEVQNAAEVDSRLKGHGERILFIDDERMICELVEKLLARLGYEVVAFSDPVAAVRAFREAPDRFDLVITDLTMPRTTGIDVARDLLALRPGLPVVLVSGYSPVWTDESVRAEGLCGLVSKPLSTASLAWTIRRVLPPRASSRTPFL